MAKGHDELRAELGGEPLDGVAALSAKEAAALAEAVRNAKAGETAALRQATEAALGHVPRLLRGPVKKIVFG